MSTLHLVPPSSRPAPRAHAEIARLLGMASLRAHNGDITGMVLAVRTVNGWEVSGIGLTNDERREADALDEALGIVPEGAA